MTETTVDAVRSLCAAAIMWRDTHQPKTLALVDAEAVCALLPETDDTRESAVILLRAAYADESLSDGAFRFLTAMLLWPRPMTEADIRQGQAVHAELMASDPEYAERVAIAAGLSS